MLAAGPATANDAVFRLGLDELNAMADVVALPPVRFSKKLDLLLGTCTVSGTGTVTDASAFTSGASLRFRASGRVTLRGWCIPTPPRTSRRRAPSAW
ncbi:MAG: hypothetical protein R3F60_26635 [bacterium]